MLGRIAASLLASVAIGLAALVGGLDWAIATAFWIGVPFVAAVWPEQLAGGTSNLQGVSIAGLSPGRIRFLGWFALLAFVALSVVALTPLAFPVER